MLLHQAASFTSRVLSESLPALPRTSAEPKRGSQKIAVFLKGAYVGFPVDLGQGSTRLAVCSVS